MIRFFQEVRPDSRIVEGAGDMLLYQWGVHDWGQGPSFQLNITRQFIELVEEEGEDDEGGGCMTGMMGSPCMVAKCQSLESWAGTPMTAPDP